MADNPELWFEPQVTTLEHAILYTLAYADIYDYPLTLRQLQRYLIGIASTPESVASVLDNGAWARRHVARRGDYYMLPGRESLAELRRHRAAVAQSMWQRARRYAASIARIPFVRMVALTGALTMENVEADDDYDYLIVTEHDHLWLARFLIVQGIVKPAQRRREEVCPNYLITARALALDESERDLYHAHELAQMIPFYGLPVYRQLRAANTWADRFLPNATGAPQIDNVAQGSQERRFPERLLRMTAGAWFEQREMARMARKLAPTGMLAEVLVTPDQCKGHVGAHDQHARQVFEARLEALVREFQL